MCVIASSASARSARRITTVSSPAVRASARTRGYVSTPTDGLNDPAISVVPPIDRVHRAHEVGARRVRGEGRSDRQVDDALRGPGLERRGGHRPARVRRRRQRRVVAVFRRGRLDGAGVHRVVAAAARGDCDEREEREGRELGRPHARIMPQAAPDPREADQARRETQRPRREPRPLRHGQRDRLSPPSRTGTDT